ncbi:MAG: hypothetical protein IKE94_10750 [Aeriscardovia sp.]|nr:hypothetical protein [Aeriscardovia sp.]
MELIDRDVLFNSFNDCSCECGVCQYSLDGLPCGLIENAPIVEAIPKADYENRLKADMVAMLENLDLKIDEMYEPQFSKEGMDGFYWAQGLFKALVQEEINALKEAADDQSGAG